MDSITCFFTYYVYNITKVKIKVVRPGFLYLKIKKGQDDKQTVSSTSQKAVKHKGAAH